MIVRLTGAKMVARVMSWMMKLSVFCIRRIKSKKMRATFTVRRRLVGFRQKRPPPSQALSLVPPRTTFPFPTHKFCMNESAGLGTWLLVTSSSPFVSKIVWLRITAVPCNIRCWIRSHGHGAPRTESRDGSCITKSGREQ